LKASPLLRLVPNLCVEKKTNLTQQRLIPFRSFVGAQEEEEAGAKRLKEDFAGNHALHDSVLQELRRLGVHTAGSGFASVAAAAAAEGAASTSASSPSEGAPLAPAFRELNSFTFPSELFECEAWDLRDVELRNWWSPSTRGGRPAVEIGSAKRRSSDAYVYLALPTDTVTPAEPGTILLSLSLSLSLPFPANPYPINPSHFLAPTCNPSPSSAQSSPISAVHQAQGRTRWPNWC
jgi:hypothetical protein